MNLSQQLRDHMPPSRDPSFYMAKVGLNFFEIDDEQVGKVALNLLNFSEHP